MTEDKLDSLDRSIDALVSDAEKDREAFQRDLAEHGDVSKGRDMIADYVDQLMGTSKSSMANSMYQDVLDPNSLATIESSKNEEEFLGGSMVSADARSHSRIMKEFTKDDIKLFYALALSIDFKNNNQKSDLLTEYLKPKGFVALGTGTNRVAYKKGRYVYKFALDRRGIADMLVESKRSEEAPNFLAHCYECCGVVAVDEYIDLIDEETFSQKPVEAAILTALRELSKEYIFGDMGYDPKNYCNLGFRQTKDGPALVFLDYAYMHPRLGNEDVFVCPKCGIGLKYNSTYTKYICPKCGSEYDYRDILYKINANAENFESSFLSDVQNNLELEELEDLAIDADI